MNRLFVLLLSLFLAVEPGFAATNFCVSNLNFVNVRLGVPGLLRGPGYDWGDSPMSFVKKNDGTFNIYGANQVTWFTNNASMILAGGTPGTGGATGSNSATIPGTGPTTIHSNLTLAIGANQIAAASPGTSTDVCGDWMTATWKTGSIWYALVHNEGPCNYAVSNTTNKSMSIYSSTNEGVTWTPVTASGTSGTAISSLEASASGVLTGFGDCTWTPDTTGMWLYTYCGFYSGYAVSSYRMGVFRVLATTPTPGNFQVLYNGTWASSALNNPFSTTTNLPQADLIDWIGTNVASVPGVFKVLAAGQDHVYNYASGETIQGITLASSNDYQHFSVLSEPLLNYDFQHYSGHSSGTLPNDDLYLYPVLRNDTDGSTVLNSSHSVFFYTWIPPGNDVNNRYIVQQSVTMSVQSLPQVLTHVPNVGVSLETWYNSGRSQYRSTTVSPYAGTTNGGVQTGWVTSAFLGYVMTKCPGSETVNECDAAGQAVASRVEECWNSSAGDYALHLQTYGSTPTGGSCPSGSVHIRTVGWLYKAPPNGFATNAVYSCSLSTGAGYHFASSDPACNGQTALGLLGYALAS